MTDAATDFSGSANPFASIGFEGGSAAAAAPSAPVDPAAAGMLPSDAPVLTITRSGTPPAIGNTTPGGDPFGGAQNPFAAIGFEADPKKTKPSAGIATNAAAGINEGVANTLGAPVDLVTGGLNLGIGGINKLTGAQIPTIQNPIGGSQSIKNALGVVGMSPDQIQAQTEAERIARGAGAGVSSAILGAGIGPVLGAAGAISAPAAEAVQAATGAPGVGTAVMGAAGGAGGQAAADIAPPQYKSLAALAGATIGGALPLAGAGAIVGAGALARGAHGFVAPNAGGVVGGELAGAMSPEARSAFMSAGTSDPIVQGSNPTLFQQTGDMGLGQWEDAVRTRNKGDFLARDADQQAARTTALQNVQPTGAPQELPEALRSQRAGIKASTQGPVAVAQAMHDAALDNLTNNLPGGTPVDTAAHFRAARDAIDNNANAQIHAAAHRAATARGEINPTMTRSEDYGNALRGSAADAMDHARAQTSKLWKAVDPEGTMTVSGTGVRNRAREIEGQLTKSAKPMDGEEKAIFDVAKSYGPRTKFSDLTDLRARVNAAMSNELRTQGRTPTWGRLTQVRGAIESAIDDAVANRAAEESVAVKSGDISSDAAAESRLREWVAEHRARKAAGGEGAGQNPVGAPGQGTLAAAGNDRTAGAAGGGAGDSAGSAPETPSLDAATAARLKAASAATKSQHQTFGGSPVGNILATRGSPTDFKLSNAEVPAEIFHSGPTGGEDVRAYVKAVGSDRASAVLSDYAATALRNKAMRPDGTFNPEAVTKFLKDHAAALAELPPTVRAKFANSAEAENAVADAVASRKSALDEFDKSAAARVAGLQDGADLVRTIGGVLGQKDGARTLDALNRATAGNADARAGLQRAVVEHVLGRFIPPTGAAKIEGLQNFVAQNHEALNKILSDQQLRDLQQRASSVVGAKASVESAQAAREGALSAHDTTIMRQLLGVHSKSDVTDIVGSIFARRDGAEAMQALADRAASAGAMEPLRKAVSDYLTQQFTSTAEAGTTGVKVMKNAAFSTFMKGNTEALEKVLSPEQVGALRAIVEDYERTNRSITATKLKGQSNTTPDLLASMKQAGTARTILGRIGMEGAAVLGGHAVGGIFGSAAAWMGEKAVAGLREAGLNRIEELRVQAALHPEIARALLEAVPKQPNRGGAALLALRARQLALSSAAASSRQMQQHGAR